MNECGYHHESYVRQHHRRRRLIRLVVSISIVAPITRRLLHPLESSDPKVIKGLQRRKDYVGRKG